MAYKQVRGFDTSAGGTTAGYCLRNVRLGFGIASKYAHAWAAWSNTEQHADRNIPSDIDVPLYYDYTDSAGNRYGHINVRLANGSVWNDGRIFTNLSAFESAWRNVRYVGWGESVNAVRVLEYVSDPIPALKPNQRLLVNTTGVNQREAPTTESKIIKEWAYEPGGNNVYNFRGYVKGQDPYGKGNNIWFVGATSGGYFYSGAFEGDGNTSGLTDLTSTPVESPVPPPIVFPPPTADPLVTRVYNKKNPIGQYVPADLIVVGNQQLRKEAAESLALMQKQVSLTPASGYRSYDRQAQLYDDYVKQDGQDLADRYSARPGYSEHQSGLAMDFSPIEDSFKFTTASAWLKQNAHSYGWVLRYPLNKELITGYQYEPWHWRYIGVKDASDMKSKGIETLEEYYNLAGGLYPDQETSPPDEWGEKNNVLLQEILRIVQLIWSKISGVFK